MDSPKLPIHLRITQTLHDRSGHDRTGHLRTDDAWVEKAWSNETTKVLVVSGNRVEPFGEAGVRWRTPAACPEGIRVLLGDTVEGARFAVLAGREEAEAALEDGAWRDLRGLFPALVDDTTEASFLMHAIGLAEWHRATRFCSRCGGRLEPRAAGHELACAEGHLSFPRTDPAVIMLVTAGEPGTDEERCLLGNHTRWPAPNFSTLAGFVEPGESLEDAVRREVAEEVGVRVGQVDYFGNQPWPLPSSLMLGFFARAESTEIAVDEDEIREARWFTRAELAAVAESGEIKLPSGISISRSLVEEWYGGELPGSW